MNNNVEICPSCGEHITVNSGYTVWCDKCEWNIDPKSGDKKISFFNKLENYIGQKHSKALLEIVVKNVGIMPKMSIARMFCFVFATIVQFIAVFLLYLAYSTAFKIPPAFTLVLIVLGCLSLPRLYRVKRKPVIRSDYPKLFKLVDDIADSLGSEKVDEIVIDGSFNASFARTFLKRGFRRKRVLILGLPLFFILSPQERVALISHEIAHNVNKDSARAFWLGTALNTLRRWYELMTPADDEYGTSKIAKFFLFIPRTIVFLLKLIFETLLWRDSQIAEYYADRLAAEISGSKYQISLLEKLHFGELYVSTIKKLIKYNYTSNFFKEFVNRINQMPQKEIDRLGRLEKSKLSRVDATHPPTVYRIEYIKLLSYEMSKYQLSEDECSDIDKELKKEYDRVNKDIVEFYKKWA